MKYTLLELTQSILSSMDSDEINSINDSPESLQVVNVIKTVYDDIVSRSDLNSNKTLFNLEASIELTKPVLMTKPDNISNIEWIKYNKIKTGDTAANWDYVTYLPVEDFITMSYTLNEDDDNVESFVYNNDGYSLSFFYKNDEAPLYYTTTDDSTIVFNSYDKAVDTILQSVKTLAYGAKKTDFVESDMFVPNLQPQQFALLLNEAKSLAWIELKQTEHPKAENTARRNWRHIQKSRQSVPTDDFNNYSHPFYKLRNFGRK